MEEDFGFWCGGWFDQVGVDQVEDIITVLV